MDSGEVIPGLNEDWTFVGAKAMEWIAGMMMMIVVSELFLHNAARNMPLLLMTWVGTTVSLAVLRRSFPDEERGLRNACMVALGFSPPDIPTPSALQPIWSGAPMREMGESKRFHTLGIAEVFEPEEEGGEPGRPKGER